jgi:hypothetical protein
MPNQTVEEIRHWVAILQRSRYANAGSVKDAEYVG